MSPATGGYLACTRHPWACLVFLLPLLAAYEGGVVWLGGRHPEFLRNGADTWLHWGLQAFGLSQLYWTPAAVGLLFFGWSWLRRYDRPEDILGVCTGMAIESACFAGGLWGISQGLAPFLQQLGIKLQLPPSNDQVLAQVVTFVGAGIYEEVLFRLLLFAGLFAILRSVQIPVFTGFLAAASVSALLFSAAHNFGPNGEVFQPYPFVFRAVAGLYFTFLFQVRGFGIAVGTHAFYDVLVGVIAK